MADKTYIIKTPAKDYTGISLGVAFVDGEGKTANPWLVQRFKESGYQVSEENAEAPIGENFDLTGLNYAELKAKAKELGLEFPGNISGDDLKAKLKEAGYEI